MQARRGADSGGAVGGGPSRVLIWFSCGATSAVAAKLALSEWPGAELVRIRIESEHEDADRFAADVAKWLKRDIITLTPPMRDHFSVIEYHRYINGPMGAKCTKELKRKTRAAYSRPRDLHVFGFDAEEEQRAADFRERNPDMQVATPLIDAGLTKADCKAVIERAGIRQHRMYELGYQNANCVGCVKGGAGYWNRIRVDFPAVFARMAALERKIGATCLKRNGQKLYLDELEPDAGRFVEDSPRDCGLFCDHILEVHGL